MVGLSGKNVDKFDINSISEKSPIGYFLEVDLNILMNYIIAQ